MVISATAPLHTQPEPDQDWYVEVSRGLELVGETFRTIIERYGGETYPGALARGAIEGMTERLDAYSTFVPFGSDSNQVPPRRVGVGVELAWTENGCVVDDIIAGSPADSADVRPGDRLAMIDGEQLRGNRLDSVYSQLTGQPGDSVTLQLARRPIIDTLPTDGMQLFPTFRLPFVPLVRSPILSGFFRDSLIEQRVLYIRLTTFSENSGNEFRSLLITKLRHENRIDSIAGVILDLRGNTGGILEEGVAVADALLARNLPIVSLEGADTAEERSWESEINPVIQDLPLVVLVDDKTASTAEVVAGAIQDNDRGLIVGRNTRGKGLVQSVIELPFESQLRLTTSWYRLPSGRVIQRQAELGSGIESFIQQERFGTHTTSTGRTVKGGHGISPEIHVRPSAEELLFERFADDGAFDDLANRLSAAVEPESISPEYVDSVHFDRIESELMGDIFRDESSDGFLYVLDSLEQSFASETDIRLSEWGTLHDRMLESYRSTLHAMRYRVSEEIALRAVESQWPRNERSLAQLRRTSYVAEALKRLRNPANIWYALKP